MSIPKTILMKLFLCNSSIAEKNHLETKWITHQTDSMSIQLKREYSKDCYYPIHWGGNLSIDNLLDFFFIHNYFIIKYNIIISYYTINKNYSENIHAKNEESKNQHWRTQIKISNKWTQRMIHLENHQNWSLIKEN